MSVVAGAIARSFTLAPTRIVAVTRLGDRIPTVPKRKTRPVLVDTAVASYELGFSADTIREMTQAGELRWVWDVSVNQVQRPAPRFWVGELLRLTTGDHSARDLDPHQVISMIVARPEMPKLRGTTICDILQVGRSTLVDLVAAGELTGVVINLVRWIDRASLVGFLERRLLS